MGDTPSPPDEREAIVRWLRGDGGKIPALSAFAGLVSGNNMPCMSGDNRNRLRPHIRPRYDSIIEQLCDAIERGDHLSEQGEGYE